ncbi:MAG TPA: hypothetical protein PLN53_08025, partial [Terricaulis sp.]|nr:hypothetical protein [Terricaulis sp.]
AAHAATPSASAVAADINKLRSISLPIIMAAGVSSTQVRGAGRAHKADRLTLPPSTLRLYTRNFLYTSLGHRFPSLSGQARGFS